MKFRYLKEICFHVDLPVRDVMAGFTKTAIHTEGIGFGIITGEANECVGVVTDGDIRSHLVKGMPLDAPIRDAMNSDFISAGKNFSSHQILRLFEKGVLDNKFRQIPVLDEKGRPIDLYRFCDFTAAARVRPLVIRAQAPVRVSFSGGGTDMSYYFRAKPGYVLSSAINKYAYASVRARTDGRIRLISKDYGLDATYESLDEIKYGDSLDLIKACVKLMVPSRGFDMEVQSEVEPGTGLGGSSAVSAAVFGALNKLNPENHLDIYQLADLAYQAERIELGIDGGWQDQYASIFGGLNLIEFRQDDIVVVPLRIPNDILLELHFNLLLFRFGSNRASGKISKDQREKFRRSKDNVRYNYERLAQLTIQMKDALLKGLLNDFGRLLDRGWKIKKEFSDKISSKFIDDLYVKAKKSGALGGKVLGAGECGYLLLFVNPSRQSEVIDAMLSKGARFEPFDFVKTGLQIWNAPE